MFFIVDDNHMRFRSLTQVEPKTLALLKWSSSCLLDKYVSLLQTVAAKAQRDVFRLVFASTTTYLARLATPCWQHLLTCFCGCRDQSSAAKCRQSKRSHNVAVMVSKLLPLMIVFPTFQEHRTDLFKNHWHMHPSKGIFAKLGCILPSHKLIDL